jgi:hypothetical protein
MYIIYLFNLQFNYSSILSQLHIIVVLSYFNHFFIYILMQ